MKKETKVKATPQKAGKLAPIVKQISELPYTDRKRLIEGLTKANEDDNQKFSLGQEADGAHYMTMQNSIDSVEE